MCLTCGCMQAHLDMGPSHIRYEDLKAAAEDSDTTVGDVLDIFERTLAKDRAEHRDEYR